ncbi:MAG: hypothetical protein RIR79_1501 [Pseudomonadota bacterium]|jgi:uroporphyrinogen-III synthase
MRVIVTRPRLEANRWVQSLHQAGLDAVALPLIAIAPANGNDAAAVQSAWNRLADFDALMFVSSNAVEHFFALMPAKYACSATNIIALATGPGTVAALQRVGVASDRIRAPQHDAGQFDSEALWAIIAPQVQQKKGFRLLVVRGGDGRNWFSEQVTQAGGVVEFVTSYQRQAPDFSADARAWVASDNKAIWLFSSSEAVANLCAAFPARSWAQARAVATHPRIAQAVRAAGFGMVRESRPTLADLVIAIQGI